MSLVDSGDGSGPLSMVGFGVDDATRKRYNVAASRAKDQLWVVHSLDAANDLKPGDMRKRLIDYAADPYALDVQHERIEAHAESPFESAVAKSLLDRGYHLVQQWKVGAYRLDMVVICGKKKVVIECDGERWHSGAEKVREDMERQTILERLGWRFIRIRGSEYYRAPDNTMNRVVSELEHFGIEPEETMRTAEGERRSSELLNRVKLRAQQIMESSPSKDSMIDVETICVALDPKSIIPKQNAKDSPVQAEEKQTTTGTQEKSLEISKAANTTADNKTRVTPPKRRTVKKAVASKTQKSHAPKTQSAGQQVTMDDVAVLKLLDENGVNYKDNRMTGGSIWLMGGHELDEIVEKVRALGVEFQFKGHWWKSI